MQEIQEILNKLREADWWSRKKLIGSLGAHPEGLYLNVLEAWLRDGDDAQARNASMEAFRALGAKALPSLERLLKDEDSDVRIFSANVLGDIGDPKALDALSGSVGDRDENVRIAAVEAIGKLGDERGIDALLPALDDDTWVLMAAIEASGKIGGGRARALLHKCLENRDLTAMACIALERSGDESSMRMLVRLLHDEVVRELALKSLISIAERKQAELMPEDISEIVPDLIELLKSPRDDVRRSAFVALSWSEDERAVPCFISAINDEGLQEYAVKGLIAVASVAVPQVVEALSRDGDNRVVLAKVLSMAGAPWELLRFASDHNPEVRTEVALAVGSLKTPEAEAALRSLCSDPAEEVRRAARLSLGITGKEGQ